MNIILIDISYYIFYRFYALHSWWKLAKPDENLTVPYENEEFVNNDPIISNEEWIEWRNSQLNRTDFIAQTPDYPNRDAWLTYRQELRDWPSTADFPETKPTKPE